jgi:hypothetical protein
VFQGGGGQVRQGFDIIGTGIDGAAKGVEGFPGTALGSMHQSEDIERIRRRLASRQHRVEDHRGQVSSLRLKMDPGQVDPRLGVGGTCRDGSFEPIHRVGQVAAVGGKDTEQVKGLCVRRVGGQRSQAELLRLRRPAGHPETGSAGNGAG